MIGEAFRPRRRLRASQLNELARSADSAHLGAAGFLSQENGLEQVARSPRRPIVARTAPATLATDAIPAVVVQAEAVPGLYRVTLYPSGIGGPSGGDAFLACTERGMEMDLPAGTIVLAHSIVLAAADDGDDGVEEEEEEEATP